MENNEIMSNEEVVEMTEEIVNASSGSGFKNVAGTGLAMLAGGLACKFIVEPAWTRFKAWKDKRRTIDKLVSGELVDEHVDVVEGSVE